MTDRRGLVTLGTASMVSPAGFLAANPTRSPSLGRFALAVGGLFLLGLLFLGLFRFVGSKEKSEGVGAAVALVVWGAALTAVALNLIGVFVFALPVSEVIEGMSGASATWIDLSGNGSLIKHLSNVVPLDPLWFVGFFVAALWGYLVFARRKWSGC